MSLSGPVNVELRFLDPPKDGSVPHAVVPASGPPQENYNAASHEVSLRDIRGHESEYNLDKDAFSVLQNIPSALTYESWDSDETVKTTYYSEVENLILKNVPGAHKVVIFDHTIRRYNPDADRQPVIFAHVDQTPYAAELRVREHVKDPQEAETLLRGRCRIINVWRPLNGKVESMPLAFATAASVAQDDLSKIERRYPHYTGETMGVKYNPNQQWLYWSGIDNDERILIKCSDTQEGVAKRVPHSAFVDPRSTERSRPRESIEVRALVFG
ncbi:putative methyltransferase [Aspergillus undulatus]|uniref:putative methyltransferase n=1 Tax=Aspergillus undulatus TaxID=1810928 RepID=UPI003CCCD556